MPLLEPVGPADLPLEPADLPQRAVSGSGEYDADDEDGQRARAEHEQPDTARRTAACRPPPRPPRRRGEVWEAVSLVVAILVVSPAVNILR